MKPLTNSLRKMLAGLACQDAGEYLSRSEKAKIVGTDSAAKVSPRVERIPTARPNNQRIALISNGRSAMTALGYIIETGKRQQAEIDLLIHNSQEQEANTALQQHIEVNGVKCHSIALGKEPVEGVLNHIDSQTNLLFLVAVSGDDFTQQIVDAVSVKRGRRIPVPLVLIEAHPAKTTEQRQQSAA